MTSGQPHIKKARKTIIGLVADSIKIENSVSNEKICTFWMIFIAKRGKLLNFLMEKEGKRIASIIYMCIKRENGIHKGTKKIFFFI